MRAQRGVGRGFVLQELVALLVVALVALALLAVSSSRSRSLASLGESMANLRHIGQSFGSYGGDYAERVATFSWRKGNDLPSQYPDCRVAFSDVEAAAKQAIDIIRRRASLTMVQFPVISGWIAHPFYSHLVLEDYLGSAIPSRTVISPEDAERLAFALDRSKWFSQGPMNARWAFSSSYEIPPAFWSSPDSGPDAISQGSLYNAFLTPGNVQLGLRNMSEVVYPSAKVLMHDRHQRHFGPRRGYFLHDEARVPALMVDGAVSVRRGADANPGWNPQSPTSQSGMSFAYTPPPMGPVSWDPPALSPTGTDIVLGRYRWTRKALAGRDFDGPQVP